MEEDIQKENLEEKKEVLKEGEKNDETSGLTGCQKERDEYLNGWKRAKADLLNYKKEEAKRFETVMKFANEFLIRELISVLDSFDLALISFDNARTNTDSARTNIKNGSHEFAVWQKGFYLIRQQLEDVLKHRGLERIIILVGQQFDINFQEVIAEIESDKISGTIIEEVERGYLLNGKLIRPARVKIAK